MADSFIFYKSFFEAGSALDPESRLAFYDAVAEYAINDVEPEITNPVAKAMFLMAKPQIDANEKRREDGAKGGRPRKKKPVVFENDEIEKPVVSENDEIEKPNVNVNANANVNVNEKKRGGFTPPTLEEVREYCKERGNQVDPETFVAYYESQNWKKSNGQKVVDWKGCVRTWEARDKAKPAREPPKKAYQTSDRQRTKDEWAALEAQLLNNGGRYA